MTADAHFGTYRFEDRSLLLRVLTRPVLAPLVRALPLWVTPNWVTMAGHLAAWVGLGAALLVPKPSAAVLLLLALNTLAYVFFDCLDGMLARHQKRTSSLGELLDHYLDALSVPIVPLSVCLAFDTPAWLTMAATGAVAFTHFTTLLHGYRVGHVVFGELGIMEGAVVASALYVAAAVLGLEPLVAPRLFGASIIVVVSIATIAGSLGALVSMRSLARRPGDFAPMLLNLALVAVWFAFGALSTPLAAVLLLFAGALPDGKITLARLQRRPLVLWDALFAVALATAVGASLALGLDARVQGIAAVGLVALAIVRGGAGFFRTLMALQAPAAAAGVVARPE